MDLSIIIVTYNEEKNISSCLDSVIKLMENSDILYEVIVVDSMSTDHTIQNCRKYDVEIIRLETFRSPSTAKYVGFHNSSGKNIFFLDGDMDILMNYSQLKSCLHYLNDDNVAGVQGSLEDYFNEKLLAHLRQVEKATLVDFLPGSAIYSRVVLEKNIFNPHINSNEERELGYRIKKAGHEMKILPFVMVRHNRRFNMEKGLTLKEISRRHKNNYYRGLGQVLRANLSSPMILLKHAYHQKVSILFFLTFILIPISLNFNLSLTYFLLGMHFLAILYYLAMYHSLSRYIDKFLQFWGILSGFVLYRDKNIKYNKI